jgi:PAS domain S-box-containing protein
MEDLNFLPVSREIELDPTRKMFYKFSPEGIIEYINDDFVAFTGFDPADVLGKKISDFRYPDIPVIIYELVESRLDIQQNTNLLLKDKTKDGRYYWYLSDFEIKKNADGKILSVYSLRKPAPRLVIIKIDKFYKKLLMIEQNAGMEVAQKYFYGFQEEIGMSFLDYTNSLLASVNAVVEKPKKKKRSFWG